MLRVLAVDLGASSVRVATLDLDASPPNPSIIHRYAHKPVRYRDGSTRWDWPRLVTEVVKGLQAGAADGPVASVGVDGWGVDYGLLDPTGRLLSAPFSYRDGRTSGWRQVVEKLGGERIYRITGTQFMAINTVFQLAAHDRSELDRAERLLMLPELMAYELTGEMAGELATASTTGLLDARTGDWSQALMERLHVDPGLFPSLRTAASPLGMWRGIPVHLVGGHDTASAVVAQPGPPPPGSVFISSGTWMLVGAERNEPDLSDRAREANFTNEAGALGGVRFLKNVMGLGMLEQCRSAWKGASLGQALRAAARLEPGGPVVDPTEERFFAPADMETEIRLAARLPITAGPDKLVRCILDSLASSAASVVSELSGFLGRPATQVVVLGGGTRNALLNHLIQQSCAIPVIVGEAEAAAVGNALVQGIALGRFSTIDEARAALLVS